MANNYDSIRARDVSATGPLLAPQVATAMVLNSDNVSLGLSMRPLPASIVFKQCFATGINNLKM